MDVVRLYLGTIDGPLGRDTPIHGYAIKHPKGVVLVDTGMGTPPRGFNAEWKLVLRTVADALADHDLSPADVAYVVQTHLHSDHCGENVVFRGVPVILQASELGRARREQEHMLERFDHRGARFELLEGDAEVLPGVHALHTPGHTCGHQSVLIDGAAPQLIVGDAAYTVDIWEHPDAISDEARERQIQGDVDDWRRSLERLRGLTGGVDCLHFCHDAHVLRRS